MIYVDCMDNFENRPAHLPGMAKWVQWSPRSDKPEWLVPKVFDEIATKACAVDDVVWFDLGYNLWPWDVRHTPRGEVETTFQRLSRLCAEMRVRQVSCSFYCNVLREYYISQGAHESQSYIDWQNACDVVRDGLSRWTYASHPSLYTFSDNLTHWDRYAAEHISVARRWNKPVLPFIWFEYHDSTVRRGEFLPTSLLRHQLQFCKRYADGFVIWGGYNYNLGRKRNWSEFESSDQWKVIQEEVLC